jgi:RNA-splicing ligase RtcB
MKRKDILVRGQSQGGLTEEKPDAYKNVNKVVDVVRERALRAR